MEVFAFSAESWRGVRMHVSSILVRRTQGQPQDTCTRDPHIDKIHIVCLLVRIRTSCWAMQAFIRWCARIFGCRYFKAGARVYPVIAGNVDMGVVKTVAMQALEEPNEVNVMA